MQASEDIADVLVTSRSCNDNQVTSCNDNRLTTNDNVVASSDNNNDNDGDDDFDDVSCNLATDQRVCMVEHLELLGNLLHSRNHANTQQGVGR